MLIVRRSSDDKHMPGIWEFPGGKLEIGQNLSGAQIGEARQETGLEIETTNQLMRGDDYIIPEGKYSGMPYIVLVGLSKLKGGELELSREHDEARWILSESELEELDSKPEVEVGLHHFKENLGWDS